LCPSPKGDSGLALDFASVRNKICLVVNLQDLYQKLAYKKWKILDPTHVFEVMHLMKGRNQPILPPALTKWLTQSERESGAELRPLKSCYNEERIRMSAIIGNLFGAPLCF
jgi:hypothetical protein